MSKNFLNTNLVQTNINDAYKYETHSEFMKNMKMPNYSSICIYCSSNESKSLMNDGGSFRQCLKCNKQFRAKINF
jgi:hypothetical protein